MKVKPRIMVSNPVSGFGIYIHQELVDHLGGLDTALNVQTSKLKDGGSVDFFITPYKKGKLHVRHHSRASHPARIFWNTKVQPPVSYHFRPVYVNWDLTSKGFKFRLPKPALLKTAHTKTEQVRIRIDPTVQEPPPQEPDPLIAMAAAFKQMADAFGDLLEQLKKGK